MCGRGLFPMLVFLFEAGVLRESRRNRKKWRREEKRDLDTTVSCLALIIEQDVFIVRRPAAFGVGV